MKQHTEKKKRITTGIIRWWRFILIPILVIVTSDMIVNSNYNIWLVSILLVFYGITYLLWKHRQLRFDSKHLYIKHGNDETSVHLSNVISIKRSRAKVNGSRYWVLIYTERQNNERKLRFKSDFNKEFFETVKENNPEVVIWEHPFFNH